MVVWHGVLKIKEGLKDDYIRELKEHDFVDQFTKQPGNIFYSIGQSIVNEDELIVCDAWDSKDSFTAHDTSKEVDVWRDVYNRYVEECVSKLIEI